MKAATPYSEYRYEACGISIHAAREGGDNGKMYMCRYTAISIHAAREGGDLLIVCVACIVLYFNPRRP